MDRRWAKSFGWVPSEAKTWAKTWPRRVITNYQLAFGLSFWDRLIKKCFTCAVSSFLGWQAQIIKFFWANDKRVGPTNCNKCVESCVCHLSVVECNSKILYAYAYMWSDWGEEAAAAAAAEATGAGLIKCQCNASSNSFHMSHKSNQTKSKAKPVDSQLLLLLLLHATASGKYLTEFHSCPPPTPCPPLTHSLLKLYVCIIMPS